MNDVVLELDVESGASEAAFHKAVDRFTKWRESFDNEPDANDLAPDLIIKTVVFDDGRFGKQLIFQDRVWVQKFMSFWSQVTA